MKTFTYKIVATVTKEVTVDAETPEDAERKMRGLASLFLKIGADPVIRTLNYERQTGADGPITHFIRRHIPTGSIQTLPFEATDMLKGNAHRVELVALWNWLGSGTWEYRVAQ